jgi:phthalate 4,5-cis-dihydrodiol dehydrogenase
VRALTGAWDTARSTEAAYSALLTFDSGAFATLTYNGYGHYDSDEMMGWVGEMGEPKAAPQSPIERGFGGPAAEAALKAARNYGGENWRPMEATSRAHQHFGPLLVSCDGADLRPLPTGIMIYQNGASRFESLPAPQIPRSEVIDELYDAAVNGRPPLHDGGWARATLEVCLAMLHSAREGRDVALRHQVAVR